jgi:hypothetical protein
LSFGQTIDLVVHDHNSDVDIAQRGMDQVASADAEHIAIAAHSHDSEIGARHLHTLSYWQSATVDAVEAEGADEVGKAAGAADARNHYRLIHWTFERSQSGVSGVEHTEVTAARAPRRLDIAFKIFWRQGNSWLRHG